MPGQAASVQSFNVLGTKISALTLSGAIDLMAQLIARRESAYVSVCTVHTIVESMRDPEIRRAVNGAWLATTDGMPLVWWGKRSGHRHITRVYGPELFHAFLTDPRLGDLGHFLYGGAPGVAEKIVNAARAENPACRIIGWINPPFRPLTHDEQTSDIRTINEAQPDIVWVGLGCPKQDLWMARFRAELETPLLVGVGAAFDFMAGNKPQAPGWMQRAGLEWLFRLASEPRRLWKRYLVYNTIFILHAIAQWTKLRKYPLEER